MYTIYYIFTAIILISFITGIVLDIVENKHKRKNKQVTSNIQKQKDIELLEESNKKDNDLSNTISFSTPIIISSRIIPQNIEKKSESNNIFSISKMEDEII